MTKIAATAKASSKKSAPVSKAPAKAPAPSKGKAPAKAPAKKAVETPAPAPVAAAEKGKFGERPASLKGKLIALLTAKPGKPVKLVDAKEALYGKGNPAPIEGVILGASLAFEKAGGKLLKEGKGQDATLTFKA